MQNKNNVSFEKYKFILLTSTFSPIDTGKLSCPKTTIYLIKLTLDAPFCQN